MRSVFAGRASEGEPVEARKDVINLRFALGVVRGLQTTLSLKCMKRPRHG